MDDSFFNEFFGGLFGGNLKSQENDLNQLYKSNPKGYFEKINRLKCMGYRIFRNSNGEHIIKNRDAH